MSRKARPYIKGQWYVTSIGGVQHQKLCRVEKGEKEADIALARLLVVRDDAKAGVPCSLPHVNPALLAGPQSILVSQAHDDYLTACKVETAPSTYQGYRDALDPFFERFANRPLVSITFEDGLRYKDWLGKEKPWMRGKKAMKGVGPVRVNKCIRLAKQLLNWVSRPSQFHKYGIARNPWEEIKYFVEKPRERIITDDEFKALLANCTDGSVCGGADDFREQLTVLRHTTMRPGELRLLQWDYIQWDSHRIVFPPQVIKVRTRREVSMLPVVEETLRARQARMVGRKGFVFPLPGVGESGKLTASVSEENQTSDGFAQRFRRLFERCVALGLIEKEKAGERIVLYSTRHTRITEMHVEGIQPAVIMREAGHVNPKTTERYTHLAGSFVTEQVRQHSRLSRVAGGD